MEHNTPTYEIHDRADLQVRAEQASACLVAAYQRCEAVLRGAKAFRHHLDAVIAQFPSLPAD